MRKNKKHKKVVILFLLIGVLFFNFVSADTLCTNNDCSVDISINVVGIPSSFLVLLGI